MSYHMLSVPGSGAMKRWRESGMPLGGVGAGKVEFCRDGRFTNVTINNNWDAPIIDGRACVPPSPRIRDGFAGSVAENASRRKVLFSEEGLPGAWLAFHTPELGGRVLKFVSRATFTPIEPRAVRFTAKFPLAVIDYQLTDAISLNLEAFSSLDIPDFSEGYLNSCLPLALFRFEICNLVHEALPVALAFSWQNLNGVGGYPETPINKPDPTPPEYRDDVFAPGLWFGHAGDAGVDQRVLGDYSLRVWTGGIDSDVSHCAGWDPGGDGHDVWDSFARRGELSNERLLGTAGALGARVQLRGGERATVVFALSWNMPHLIPSVSDWENLVSHSSAPPEAQWLPNRGDRPDYGHAYSHWFGDSWKSGEYGLREWESIRARLGDWQGAISESNLPQFFSEALCNDLFPLFANTWYTRDRRFAVNEAPTDMEGCMGTIDQRAVANGVVAAAFPELDRSELDLFAKDQVRGSGDPRRFSSHWNMASGRFDLKLDREGAILHDVGWDHLEGGRTGSDRWLSAHWPDLTSVFILQSYQHAIWNGSSAWLDALYPKVQAALRFQDRLDQDGDGLPDLWGSGSCTYDTELYPYYGASSYAATLYLAALRAAEQMAIDHGDTNYLNEIRERISKAGKTAEDKLWDETRGYYISWRDDNYVALNGTPKAHGPASLNCHIGQLAGAWWADLLCLEEVLEPRRRVRALEAMYRLNVERVRGCPANEADPGGAYSESWPPYALVYYACQAISAGLPDQGWRAIEKIYRVRQELDGSPWDTPLVWAAEENEEPQWGRWYMSNPASWYVLFALSGVRIDRIHGKLRVAPSWPSGWGNALRKLPVFLPGAQYEVSCEKKPGSWSVAIGVRKLREPLILRQVETKLPKYLAPGAVKVEVSGVSAGPISIDSAGRVVIEGPFELKSDRDFLAIDASETSAAVGTRSY